ncbi:MAG: hypothetical protein ABI777_09570, partial [Betaproteobacteria bacterium]
RQRGWVGMIVILIALAIVAWMSKDALMKYGLLAGSGGTRVVKGGGAMPGERTGSPVAGAVDGMDPSVSAPTPTAALEKARALEGQMQRAAESAASKMP